MSNATQWSYEYPWGRKSPERRRAELEARRREVERRRRILQDRYRERMVDFDRQVEAIQAEIELTEKCEGDRIRRRMREVAHRMLDLGVDVFDEIDRTNPTPEALENLLDRERKARSETSADEEPKKTDTSIEDGFIDDELVTEDDLNIFTS